VEVGRLTTDGIITCGSAPFNRNFHVVWGVIIAVTGFNDERGNEQVTSCYGKHLGASPAHTEF
jgi:hypothetical protein